jgi:hypothetical protein
MHLQGKSKESSWEKIPLAPARNTSTVNDRSLASSIMMTLTLGFDARMDRVASKPAFEPSFKCESIRATSTKSSFTAIRIPIKLQAYPTTESPHPLRPSASAIIWQPIPPAVATKTLTEGTFVFEFDIGLSPRAILNIKGNPVITK